MRVKVRTVEPPVATAGLEEIVAGARDARAEAAPSPGSRAAGPAAGDTRPAATAFHLETHERPIGAADLGPNGDVVLDLLSRAARLTAAERRALDKEAAWRWWLLSPLPGAGMLGARAMALAGARAADRTAAVAALEKAVAALVAAMEGPKARRSRVPACISNAALAVLVRDLIEPEAFEALFGPWREVMHH
jgi:hypothetical protein